MSLITKETLKKKLRADVNGTLVGNIFACLLTSGAFLIIPFGTKLLLGARVLEGIFALLVGAYLAIVFAGCLKNILSGKRRQRIRKIQSDRFYLTKKVCTRVKTDDDGLREHYFEGVEGYVVVENGAEVQAGCDVWLVYLEGEDKPLFGIACRDREPDAELAGFVRKE